MPAPTTTPLPAAPLRSQNPATFASQAETFVDALEDLPGEINAFGEYLDGLGLDPGDAYTDAAARLASWEVAPTFVSDGDFYVPAREAMTIAAGNAAIGTGTLAYEKSTAAAPGTFSSTTLPATLGAGAWLKITASGVTGFVACHLVRSA